MHTLTAYQEDQERVKFEQWARPIWRCLEDWERAIRNPSGYNSYEIQAAWTAWKARAAMDLASRETI